MNQWLVSRPQGPALIVRSCVPMSCVCSCVPPPRRKGPAGGCALLLSVLPEGTQRVSTLPLVTPCHPPTTRALGLSVSLCPSLTRAAAVEAPPGLRVPQHPGIPSLPCLWPPLASSRSRSGSSCPVSVHCGLGAYVSPSHLSGSLISFCFLFWDLEVIGHLISSSRGASLWVALLPEGR